MGFFNNKKWLTTAVVGTMVLAACGDDPVGLDEHDEHAEPEGVVLRLNAQVIASYDEDEGKWTGELEVDVGEETGHIDVIFVDHDGDAIEIDEDLYLEVVIGNKAIADFEQDTPGEFAGHLHGESVGETTAVFRLMHGTVGAGHPDFETSAVHVHVNPA